MALWTFLHSQPLTELDQCKSEESGSCDEGEPKTGNGGWTRRWRGHHKGEATATAFFFCQNSNQKGGFSEELKTFATVAGRATELSGDDGWRSAVKGAAAVGAHSPLLRDGAVETGRCEWTVFP